MAEAIPTKETEEQCLKQEMGLKCRQCRSGFLVESKNESHDPLLSSTTDLYLIKDDELPEWISEKIEEVSNFDIDIRNFILESLKHFRESMRVKIVKSKNESHDPLFLYQQLINI